MTKEAVYVIWDCIVSERRYRGSCTHCVDTLHQTNTPNYFERKYQHGWINSLGLAIFNESGFIWQLCQSSF